MYSRTQWKDHVVERPNTYTEVQNADGSVTHEPAPGAVIVQGTQMNASNFNNLEEGAFASNTAAMENYLMLRSHEQRMDGIDERDTMHENEFAAEVKNVGLTNSADYPFNNSKRTVSLLTPRKTLNYTVEVEVLSDRANIGSVLVTEKQLNGFKVAFDGSAQNVDVKLIVKGGFIA